MELNYNGTYIIGTTHPGAPFILIGKTNHFSWGVTAVLADVSDLYKEKLNEDQT
jgi:penicillin amidase